MNRFDRIDFMTQRENGSGMMSMKLAVSGCFGGVIANDKDQTEVWYGSKEV